MLTAPPCTSSSVNSSPRRPGASPGALRGHQHPRHLWSSHLRGAPGPVLPSLPRGWQRTHGLITPNLGGRWHHHALVVTNNFTSPVLFSAEINLQCLMSQNRNNQWLLLSFSIFAASWLTLKSNYCSLFGGTCLLSNGHIAGPLCQLRALMELQIAAATLTDSPA